MTSQNYDASTHVGNVEGSLIVNNFNSSSRLPQYSIVAQVVKLIADEADMAPDADRQQDDYDIDLKIEHNELHEHVMLVDMYYEYASIIERAFNAMDSERLGHKNLVLKTLNSFYKSSLYKRGYKRNADRSAFVRGNADFIVDDVIEKTKLLIKDSDSVKDCLLEDFLNAVHCVVGYGIIECQVLEKP